MIERYYLKEMKDIWCEKNYYRKWVQIEAAVLKVRGMESLAARLLKIDVEPQQVRDREKISGHELNAFLSILQERVKDSTGEIHKGLTSSDIMDTARILQIKDSIKQIQSKMAGILEILKNIAVKNRDLIMCGRTHGQIAEPITLGLKFSRYLDAGRRSSDRLKKCQKNLLVGQISGAVGTYSLVTPVEEELILKELKLKPASITSQVLPRDIFAEYVFILALISSFAEEISQEIRLLSQDLIKEVSEPFTSKQTGSSAMPHKKNPVICERICGLARLVKSHVGVALSNIALWNERDISHSSNERIILEEASSLTYYLLDRLFFVLENINIHKENIKDNVEKAGVMLFSSGVLKSLLDAGISRKEAYKLTQDMFRNNFSRTRIKNVLIKKIGLSDRKAEEVLSSQYFLNNIKNIFERIKL
ncbi:adenylosuccinate lyase [Elusimicrobiota bacterium]